MEIEAPWELKTFLDANYIYSNRYFSKFSHMG